MANRWAKETEVVIVKTAKDLVKYVSSNRWKYESKGISVSFGKELSLIFSISSLPALERTRNALRDAELLDENGNVASTATIVCDGVPALLTHEQLSTILTIGSQFVEKLRRREAATIQQIIAGTITTKEQVDKINWV